MIPVRPATEPPHFDERVRKKGLDALAEMVGQKPLKTRRGRKRKKIATRRDQIPADRFPPFWRDALTDMRTAYRRLCAYSALYIEHATGSPTVDHVIPKSKSWQDVYEWSNYRLACALVNAHKNNTALALDPFTISDGLFALEFVCFQVVVGPSAQGSPLASQVQSSIVALGLNGRDFLKAREEYVTNYESKHIDLSYLSRRAPFIAQEMRRQGKLRPGDT